jgi:hypothetical protein
MPAPMALVVVGLTAALLQGPAALRVVEKGDQSNVDEERQVWVRTQEEWTTLWRQHSPDRARPAVDFSREMVVGVFLGSRMTAGFAVDIVDVAPAAGGHVARYRVTRPAQGAVTAQVLIFPYHLVAVPAGPGTMTFQRIE